MIKLGCEPTNDVLTAYFPIPDIRHLDTLQVDFLLDKSPS
jgi:hypothetical protein